MTARILIATQASGISSRPHNYIVKVDGVEVFRAPTRSQAEFVLAWVRRNQPTEPVTEPRRATGGER